MWLYVSCRRWTCAVEVDAMQTIIATPPLLRKFIGQPFGNLQAWATRLGGCRVEHMKEKR